MIIQNLVIFAIFVSLLVKLAHVPQMDFTRRAARIVLCRWFRVESLP